jgi:hypothetical protein
VEVTPTHAKIIALLRTVAKAEIHQWHHPTDEELERLWDERIVKMLDDLEKDLGDDGK